MLINHVHIGVNALLFPLIILEVYIFGAGLSLFLAAAYVKYRDISYIWEVNLQGLFYLTPILYPISRITSLTLKKILLLNPMAQAIQDARYMLVTPKTETISSVFNGGYYRLIPYAITLLTFVIGVLYFRKESKYFAENI